MNYFEQATLGFDKVTQGDRDLWDIAIETTIEHIQSFIDSQQMSLDWIETAEQIMLDLLDCKTDGCIDNATDSRKMLPR